MRVSEPAFSQAALSSLAKATNNKLTLRHGVRLLPDPPQREQAHHVSA